MELKVTSVTKLAVLLALQKKPMHGYALMDEVQASLGVRPGPAQIYPFLEELVKKKLISSPSPAGIRERKIYSLTAKGRAFVSAFVGKMGSLLEGALEGRVTQCSHCSCRIFGKAFTKTVNGHRLGFCCPHCAENFLAGGKHAGL